METKKFAKPFGPVHKEVEFVGPKKIEVENPVTPFKIGIPFLENLWSPFKWCDVFIKNEDWPLLHHIFVI